MRWTRRFRPGRSGPTSPTWAGSPRPARVSPDTCRSPPANAGAARGLRGG
jgi:hypothetical protein